MIEPTENNVKKYEKWSSSHFQSNTFFGDLVPKCYQCEINAGETMFIPTGEWNCLLSTFNLFT